MLRRVLVADDHELVLRGVCGVLTEAYPEADVRAATSTEAVLSMLDEQPWDLLVLDLLMPGPSVLEVIRRLRSRGNEVPILVITGAPEVEYVLESMAAGASGVVRKTHAAKELLVAVRQVVAGRSYLHSETAAEIAAEMRRPDEDPLHERLTPREIEVLLRIAQAQTVKEVAADLGISPKTVATYLTRIRTKTGLSSHVEITRYALKNGLVR